MLIQDEWAGTEDMFETTFGEEKSNRKRFGPGVKCTKALK